MRNFFKILTVIAVAGGLAACNKNEDLDRPMDLSGGCEAVDLGLSVKWASCNVGASAPEECGSYFAWGETQEKEYYNWNKDGDYKWGTDNSYEILSGMTKYTSNFKGGDGLDTLLPEDDAATVNWGAKWRTPTVDEIKELLDEKNCKWTWDDQKKGYTVTGLRTGNSIFLPVTGYRIAYRLDQSEWGCYWSSSLYPVRSAYYILFTNVNPGFTSDCRSAGQTVRAVTEY